MPGLEKTVKVEEWNPLSRREVYRLLEEGWQIIETSHPRQRGCHNSFIFENQSVVYVLKCP